MSRTESRYITEDTYRTYRHKQDEDIKKEFVVQASLIENVRSDLSADLSTFRSEMKDEMHQVKTRMDRMEDEMAKIQSRFDRMDGKSFNKSRNLPHHTIAAIGVYRDAKGMCVPGYFPSTIKEFWKLRDPDYRRLIYLVEFYNIQNFQYWGHTQLDFNSAITSDDSANFELDSEVDPSKQELSLEDAVKRYPDVALDELATYLGLPISDIRNYFQRLAAYQKQERPLAIKRQASPLSSSRRALANRPSPPAPRSPHLPLAELLATSFHTSSTHSTHLTKLGWDTEATAIALAEALAKGPAVPSHSTGSSTDVIPSQEQRYLGHRRNSRSDMG